MPIDHPNALKQAHTALCHIVDNVERAIIGKRSEIELCVIAMASQGHLLLEDVPGVGKTVLARALARSTGCSFKRIQFTPDLLPSDVTGVSIYNQHSGDFEYRPGPIMAQVVLADEINRATPRAQASLLESMEEHQVTVDGVTHALPAPFLVLATQNPVEHQGAFPLPESQLDRFMMRIHLGYPSPADEVRMLERQQSTHPLQAVGQVIQPSTLLAVQDLVHEVYVDAAIRQYVVELVSATRRHASVALGASPRGSLALHRSAQARALLEGRDYVLPDDVKANAPAVLAHRLILQPGARYENVTPQAVMEQLVHAVPVPGGRVFA